MNLFAKSVFQKSAITIEKYFILSAALILLITGAAKLYSAGGTARILQTIDPILNIPFRDVVLIAAVAELAVAIACLLNRNKVWPLSLVAWLVACFFAYRMGLWTMDYRSPCSCLGAITEALNLTSRTADQIAIAILAYLLTGSYSLLLNNWLNSRKTIALLVTQ